MIIKERLHCNSILLPAHFLFLGVFLSFLTLSTCLWNMAARRIHADRFHRFFVCPDSHSQFRVQFIEHNRSHFVFVRNRSQLSVFLSVFMSLYPNTQEALEEINTWIGHRHTIMEDWGLKRILKPGYRALFYGPPGTGKTLAATLLGKKNRMDVYRVDLSMIVSKYIGETEKNLAKVFDLAENRNWILFFDEADALFGKRTSTNTSNDRHANQEVAYLLQRIEDFPGTLILATNLRSNIDEAFSRRFQSVVYFPMPDEELRRELWRNMLPAQWLGKQADGLIALATGTELSGGSITNVVRRCALQLLMSEQKTLDKQTLKEVLQKETQKM